MFLRSVVDEHAENQSSTLGQDIETIKDPDLIPDKDLTELEQIEKIPPSKEHQQVHTLQNCWYTFSFETRIHESIWT